MTPANEGGDDRAPGGRLTRRALLAGATAVAAAGAAAALLPHDAKPALDAAPGAPAAPPAPVPAKSRVVVIRHEALMADAPGPPAARIRELLDEAAAALARLGRADAWAAWLKPNDLVAIKVNCLGYSTTPAVAVALAAAIGAIGLPPERTLIWDRATAELKAAGYDVQAAGKGLRCYGTDALAGHGNAGYAQDILTSGAIGSLFSRIVTDEATALVSAPVLKDHNLCGLTGALKNFYGAIHNPNKYHDNGCDPFIADVGAAAPIRGKLRLTVFDAIRPQYAGGPSTRTRWQWPYGGLILGTDAVAVDRVACEILDRKRRAADLPPLARDMPTLPYLASAEARGLGTADLAKIEVISLGKAWVDIG
jgi:uncharacterized protein (DUF362 family)